MQIDIRTGESEEFSGAEVSISIQNLSGGIPAAWRDRCCEMSEDQSYHETFFNQEEQ